MAFISVLLQIFWKKLYRTVSGEVLYQPYEFCPNCRFWLIAMATERLNFRTNIQRFHLRSHEGDEAETLYKCSWHKPLSKLYFFIVVAHVLRWEKWKLAFISVLTADILTKVLLKCFSSSPLQPYEFCPYHWFWLVAMAIETLNFSRETKTLKNSNVPWIVV